MPPYPLPDTDPAYTLAPGSFNPQDAVPQQMDPGSMSRLFGDDNESQPGDQTSDQADSQDTDQAQGPPDQGKLQNVLSDPGLLMSVAQVLKTLGTGNDTDLVHVTDREKQILKQAGGKGTVNPTTGLLQYASSGAPEDLPTPDWYNMHPDARVARIANMSGAPPGWRQNWWSNPDAPQGGMTRNITGSEFAGMNAAVNPSWGNALGMASLVAGLGMGGPLGLIGKLAGNALSNAVLGKSEITDPFADAGPSLSQDVQAKVADAWNTGGPVAANAVLAGARADANVAANTPGAAPVGGFSENPTTHELGASFASFGGGGTYAGGAAMAAADAASAGNIDRGSGTAGGGGGAGGGNGGGGGGGLGGGAGNRGGGSNRSD